MDTETYEICKGTIVHKSRPPLDVRIVAYLLYFFGFVELAVSFLWSITGDSPVDHTPRRVLFGTIVLATGSAEAIYIFWTSSCTLFSAWGLMRRLKFAWWLTVVFHILGWVDTAFSFPRLFSEFPLSMVGSIVLGLSLFIWLWLRRELYGVRLGARRMERQEAEKGDEVQH